MFLAGQIRHPVTVTIQIPPNWIRIAAGLDPVPGRPNTYTAARKDVHYAKYFASAGLKVEATAQDAQGLAKESPDVNKRVASH